MSDAVGTEVVVGLGGASLGNHRRALTDAEARRLLDQAWAHGIRHFDTAPHYGLGLSECRLGEFLSDKPRHEFTVSTKVGRLLEPQPDGGAWDDEGFVVPAHSRRRWDFSRAGVRRSLEESLSRLRLDHVDIAYLHDPERCCLHEALAAGSDGLEAARDEKLTELTGVGSMSIDALAAAARNRAYDDLMIAGRLTLLDTSATSAVLPGCAANGIDITAAAVLNGGLLAAGRPEEATFDYGTPGKEVVRRAHRIVSVCRQYDVPPGAAAVQFPLRFERVRRLVLGFDEPAQLSQTLAWLRLSVPRDLWAELAHDGLIP